MPSSRVQQRITLRSFGLQTWMRIVEGGVTVSAKFTAGHNRKPSEQNFNLFSIKHSSLRYKVSYSGVSMLITF